MELNLNELTSKVYLIKEKADIFEYSKKTDLEITKVYKFINS